jgi:hypothetical protein
MGAITAACSNFSNPQSPPSTTTTTTTTPTTTPTTTAPTTTAPASPTQKSIDPTGGNLFTPPFYITTPAPPTGHHGTV